MCGSPYSSTKKPVELRTSSAFGRHTMYVGLTYEISVMANYAEQTKILQCCGQFGIRNVGACLCPRFCAFNKEPQEDIGIVATPTLINRHAVITYISHYSQ